MFERPLHANKHCRHYDYVPGSGPQCAVGIDLTRPPGTYPCMPESQVLCDKRENFTDAERAAWDQWCAERMGRMMDILSLIPGSSRDRKNRPHWGEGGTFDCPACKVGKVAWSRARSNGHLMAQCSTSNCFSVIE